MSSSTLALIAIVLGLGSPLLVYLGTARKLSGRVKTTEAATLWEEANNLREEYRGQIAALRKQIDDHALRVVKLEEERSALRREHENCEERVQELKVVVEKFRLENTRLSQRVGNIEP